MAELGLAAWGMREMTLEEQLTLTESLGLSLLEFSIANAPKDALTENATPAEIEAVRAAFRRHPSVRLECGCTGNDFTGDDPAPQVAKVEKVIRIAAQLGLRTLRIFAGFSSDSVVKGERWQKMVEALREVCEFATSQGVTLCMETHGGVSVLADKTLYHYASVTTRVDTVARILQATGLSLCFDPANLSAVGAVCEADFYRRFQASILYIHLKDFRPAGEGLLPAACGDGGCDWPKLAEILKAYNGPAMLEYEIPANVAEGMKRSLEFLRKIGV